jgi:hypothetical protein
MHDKTGIKTYENDDEKDARSALEDALVNSSLPSGQLISNLGLYLDAKALSRILFMDFIYRQILDTEGVVLELGTRWGQNMTLFQTLRGIYEPFNRHRKVVGFDTFEGFPSIRTEDGTSEMMTKGNLSLTPGYLGDLEKLLSVHEKLNPLGHIKKTFLVKGDATQTLPAFLEDNPQTVVALAYFDFDIYQPTFDCLNAIAPRLTKGSVVAFDEVNDPDSPGETLALMDAVGLRNIRLKRYRHTSRVSYFVVE